MKATISPRIIAPLWGSRLAAIGATAALTAAVFVLPAKAETDPKAVIKTYADIALAKYEDSMTTAQALDKAVDALVASPSADTLNAAREA
ncbi:imelysin family protein, partial [Mesorhizobium sp. M3A.F.Ca.ET.201.01.1.1]|uniref:imelysin family protein n=1 Tax=Mesorhizobium sp. M3A.F.Ca.ET.201.01.1.1 TaxID=2563946 RepID=UPI00248494FA